MFRRKAAEETVSGEAVVTEARSAGGAVGGGGVSSITWHLTCRLYLNADSHVDFETRIGGTFKSAGDLTFSVGDTVPVRYDPSKPADATVDVDAIRARRDATVAASDATLLARAEHEQIERLRQAPVSPTPEVSGCRLVVDDVAIAVGKVSVLGRVEGGALHVGDEVTINGKNTTRITGIEIFRVAVEEAKEGQHVALTLDSLDPNSIFAGDLILRV